MPLGPGHLDECNHQAQPQTAYPKWGEATAGKIGSLQLFIGGTLKSQGSSKKSWEHPSKNTILEI